MKKLALILALCLLASMLPSFAEEAEDAWDAEEYIEEEVPPEAVGETGAEGLVAEPEGDAPDDPYDLEQYEHGEEIESDLLLETEEYDLAVEAPDAGTDAEPAQVADAAAHTDPKGPQLASNQLTLGVGEEFSLEAKLPDGETGEIGFASTDDAIASVSADGVVKAVAPGEATITATAPGGAYCECFVSVRKAPKSVSFAKKTFALGKGEKTSAIRVDFGGESGEYAGGYTLTSSKKKIVSVDADGALRGLKTGKCVLTVTTYNGLTAKCKVVVKKPPKKVTARVDKPLMGVGETGQASYKLPKKTASQVTYSSDDPFIVAVDAVTGEMKAVGVGKTRICVKTFNGRTDAADVEVGTAPVILAFPESEFVMGVGMSTSSVATLNEGAGAAIQYSFSTPGIASVKDGAIKALKAGTAQLTATTYNGLSATCKLVVKPKPRYVKLPYKTLRISVGESVQLEPDVGDSASTFTYAVKSKKRVSVTPDGIVTGLAKGKTTITIKTYNNKKFKLKVIVSNKSVEPLPDLPVNLEGLSFDIPARTTDTAGISANLARIEALRTSAVKQINDMRVAGVITAEDANKRKSIVNNAFADYAFPWMTPAYQVYWKKANSEGGVKDFKPGIVYYGLPYISGSGKNRLYNANRALREARYTNSGKGYYLLNRKNLLNKKYCGNDCSGFVDAAIWGTGKHHSADRTTEIAKSDAYRTIKEFGSLRTGDLICKSGAHVVMFLYWASEDKSQMMIIENGGIEPGTNTVHCIIMDTAYYQSRGYKVRRLDSLG